MCVYVCLCVSGCTGLPKSTSSYFKSKPLKPTKREPVKATYRNVWTSQSCNEIRFYNTYGSYGEFTNFYPCPSLVIDDEKWKTTEHYFQAQKFVGTPYVEHIRGLKTPREALQFSRLPKVQSWIRSDWHFIKDEVMKKALLCKFLQNDCFKAKLLQTWDKRLVEHTSNDSYWGDGGDGSGKNKLGNLLMDVRDLLKHKKNHYDELRCQQKWHDQTLPAAEEHQKPRIRRSNSISNPSSLSSTPPQRWKDTSLLVAEKRQIPRIRRSNSMSNLSTSLHPQFTTHSYI